MVPLPILALAAASFGIGTTEFVIMGLLPDVARSLDVTVPQAGYLVSGYAMGVVVGAPLMAMATARLPRKTALMALMAIFLIGNIGCALAPSYWLLMAARVLTAFAHGAFFGISAVVASDLVPRHQRTQAVSLVFAGLTIANILGVPLGTALGQVTGWRSTFVAVVAIGVVAGLAMIRFLPSGLPGSPGGLTAEFRALRRWPVLLPMLISVASSISLFGTFTYIAPLLEHVSGLTPQAVTGALFVFGIGITLGNFAGGRLADKSALATIAGSFLMVVLVMVAFAFTSASALPAVLTVGVWGFVAFAVGAPLQLWVVDAATEAPNLASTLNQGAFNLGNALGAWIGGVAISAGVGYAELPWISAAIAVVALGLTLSARGASGRNAVQTDDDLVCDAPS
ncbi:MFS transporter [Azospirillum sp.]|uniref:MFS transporter n=1 Tax=Azospirillum sp. TaxID=34012 RepID=UPI0026041902|nr:MFS transporter [Azospirillum sp.]